MNTEILGSALNVGQWKMPIKKKEKGEPQKIIVINIENYCCHIVMSKFDDIIEKCNASEGTKKWRYAVSTYNEVIRILHKKGDYMSAEKMQFQLCMNQCYLTLHSMYRKDIAMNYWHMLALGHILWFINRLGIF